MKRNAIALSFLLVGTSVAAQTETVYGPHALRMPASARALGMGDIGVAGRDDDVLFYNPAQLIVARGTSFSVTRRNVHSAGATLSTVLRLGPGGIGFGANHLEYQGQFEPATAGEAAATGMIGARGTSTLGAIGYAQVYRGFRVGVAAKYASDMLDLARVGHLYGDVGLGRDFGRYSTGLAVQNLGPSISQGAAKVRPPMLATLGAATNRSIGPLDALATAAASYSLEHQFTGGAGAEVSWSWLSGYSLAGRAGFHQPGDRGFSELTGGFGFTADRLSIDIGADLIPKDPTGVITNRFTYRVGARIR